MAEKRPGTSTQSDQDTILPPQPAPTPPAPTPDPGIPGTGSGGK